MNNSETNNHSKKRLDTAQRIIVALGECQGLLTLAAKKAGISYSTMNRYCRDFPSVREAMHEAKETMLDYTEGKLFTAIKANNMTAIIFYLKTQGKERGYTERSEIGGHGGGPIRAQIIVQSDHAKQLTEQVQNGKGTE